ncbi:MAG: hypothetical protein ACR2M0_13450 [Chloroflexia bacterium]
MTNVPDFRGRIESDKPHDFLHKVAGIIPGYNGYQDKERRRDADKQLRMYLARSFRDEHAALVRVQQQIARSGHLESIAEVDRLAGVLQRFIDKLETASQGYAGLFDPVKVDEAALDQLYTFDNSLTEQQQNVKNAITAVGAAAKQGGGPAPAPANTAGEAPDMPTALTDLGTVLDDLLNTWNHRNDVILSGRPLPQADFEKFRAGQPGGGQAFAAPPAQQAYSAPAPAQQPYQPYTGPQTGGGQPYQPYTGPQGTEATTQRLNPLSAPPETAGPTAPSDVQGGPTGGPTDSGPTGLSG